MSQAASATAAGQINASVSPAMAASVNVRRKASDPCPRSSAVRHRDNSSAVTFGTRFGAVVLAHLAGEYGLRISRSPRLLVGGRSP